MPVLRLGSSAYRIRLTVLLNIRETAYSKTGQMPLTIMYTYGLESNWERNAFPVVTCYGKQLSCETQRAKEVEMRNRSSLYNQDALEFLLTSPQALRQASEEVCEKTLMEAKSHLHPLLRQVDLERLGQRPEFVQAFRNAFENQVTHQIILRLLSVKAVYRFDNTRASNITDWDSTIHLLVLVPQLMSSIQKLGPKLDQEIRQQLSCLNWSRFQLNTSVVEIQQVTPREIRRGVCYGAMFASFYAAPTQIWPSLQTAGTCYTMQQPNSQTRTGPGGKVAPVDFKR